MSAYTQFGYTYAPPTSQLLVGQGGGSTGSSTCCESRAVMTDPVTGQTVCSCQYDRLALGSYSRLGSSLSATTGAVYGSSYTSPDQAPYPSIGVDSSAFYSPLGTSYGMKEGATGDVSMYGTGLGASPAGYYPYDATFAAYGYGPSYDLAARRKNATRESTATLKAWLNEHKKNPYPTKGEKIMLAIITKMTLTQVSTWFANARRRLKKENKMTWEPRNKTDDDDAKLSDDEDDEKEPMDKDEDDLKKDDKDSMTDTKVEEGDCQTELKSCDGGGVPKTVTAALSPIPAMHHGSSYAISKVEKNDCVLSLPSSKPKIWSLADTATSKTPPPVIGGAAHGWLSGDTIFPLPPTIPPSQSQYNRFNQMPSAVVNNGQYIGGYSDSVGTDTPPQTPPNGNKSSSNNTSQGIVTSAFSTNSINFGSNMSACSRAAANGIDNAIHQRYNASVPINNNHDITAGNSALQNPMFSSLYKNNHPHTTAVNVQQQNVLNNQVIQVQQALQCQTVQQTAAVNGSYVS